MFNSSISTSFLDHDYIPDNFMYYLSNGKYGDPSGNSDRGCSIDSACVLLNMTREEVIKRAINIVYGMLANNTLFIMK